MEEQMNISERTLDILMNMLQGKSFDANSVKERYGTSERTFKRDLKVIRENKIFKDKYVINYNARKRSYSVSNKGKLEPEVVLAILKILIGSTALNKDELDTIEDQLLGSIATKEQDKVTKLLATTSESYIPVVDKPILPWIKDFAQWIVERRNLAFVYTSSVTTTDHTKMREGVPLNMYFANRHFYVMMYMIEKDKTFVYRLDRFKKVEPKRITKVPADKKPDEGKMLNQTYMLGGGNFIHYKFRYHSSKAVALNNVPNSHLSKDDDPNDEDYAIVEGDLYSQGALFWVLSQGPQVEVLQPESLITELKAKLKETLNKYED